MNEDVTRIDLGDDLIEKTAIISVPIVTPQKSEESSTEQIESAKILQSEGLVEDAKKILRQVLIEDPSKLEAKKNLESIIVEEEKKVFQEVRINPYLEKAAPQRHYDMEEIALLIGDLERDLGLERSANIDHGSGQDIGLVIRETEERIERAIGDASFQDRIDLGIAFLEMGVPFAAERQLRISMQLCTQLSERIIGVQLLVEALLASQRATEIPGWIDPILAESELKEDARIHLYYLRARASQMVGRVPEAVDGFKTVFKLDPLYRDTKERLDYLTGQTSDHYK